MQQLSKIMVRSEFVMAKKNSRLRRSIQIHIGTAILSIATASVCHSDDFAYWESGGRNTRIMYPYVNPNHALGFVLGCHAKTRNIIFNDDPNPYMHKDGDSVTAYWSLDYSEFIHTGKVQKIKIHGLQIDIPISPAAAFLNALSSARSISLYISKERYDWPLTTIGAGRAMDEIGRACGIPPNPVFQQQRALIWTGFLDTFPDGRLDDTTRQAIAAWQKSIGRTPWGHLSPHEYASLLAAGRAIERRYGWAQYRSSGRRFAISYPSALLSPAQMDDATVRFRSTNADVDIELRDITTTAPADWHQVHRNYVDAVRATDTSGTVQQLANNPVWFALVGTTAERIMFRRVVRTARRVEALHLTIRNTPEKARLWWPIFLMMADPFGIPFR
jgi:hypothetical protein